VRTGLLAPMWAIRLVYFYCCVDGQIPPTLIQNRMQTVQIQLLCHREHTVSPLRVQTGLSCWNSSRFMWLWYGGTRNCIV
jgi:hypothetical protein